MRNLNIHFHADPAHGWAEIPLELIQELGISGQISRYSYRNGDKAYLEEDCDLSLFMHKAEEKGWNVTFKERNFNHDCAIRNYQRYTNKD